MRLFPPVIQIGDEEGFSEKDLFGRAELADGLTNLVGSTTDPLAIAVDGPWGSGKTVFLQMWAGELRKAGFPVIYFDAFKHDYMPDAFTAIAGEIVSLAQKRLAADQSKLEEIIGRTKGAAKVILRASLEVGARAATLGLFDGKVAEDIAKQIAEGFSRFEDKYLGELLTKRRKEVDAIEVFRQTLEDLPKLLNGNESLGADEKPKPLIFILDELDRCRPTFSLEILERIKHFFSVPGVHFVFGVDFSQLQKSVIATYGQGIDADSYLRKFILLRVFLGDETNSPHENVSSRYVNYLCDAMELKISKFEGGGSRFYT